MDSLGVSREGVLVGRLMMGRTRLTRWVVVLETYLLSPPDTPSNAFVLAAHYGYLTVPSAESDTQTLSTRVN